MCAKRKKHIKIKVLIFVFILAVFTAGYFYNYLSSLSKNPSTGGEGKIETTPVEGDNSVNILVMGVDVGDPKSTSKGDPKRTDTIMVVNYNPVSKAFNVISIPRDTLIKINGKNTKINSAYAIGGINYSIKAVQKLLDIDINYYGKLDYKGFRKIIDAIGGVDMEIKQNMNYDDSSQNLSIHFKKGQIVHLDGEKAEEFFRWRKNNDGTGLTEGDIGRIQNQHLFMEKVVQKLKSPAIIPKIPSIMAVIPEYCDTNMNPKDILKYGWLTASADKNNIKIMTLKGSGEYIGGISYFLYDEKQNTDILSILHDKNTGSRNEVDSGRENLKVEILNGTNRSGLAGTVKNQMEGKGYKYISIGNNQKTAKSKIILNGVNTEKVKKMVSKDLGVNNLVTNSEKSAGYDVIVVLGNDYNLND